jgi:hypothetical protein
MSAQATVKSAPRAVASMAPIVALRESRSLPLAVLITCEQPLKAAARNC